MSESKVMRLAIIRPLKLTAGVVELKEALAAPLIQSGALKVLDDRPPLLTKEAVDDLSKDDRQSLFEILSTYAPILLPESQAESNQTQVPEWTPLVTAIAKLDPENTALWTQSGKPQVSALEALAGREITASERDEAWATYLAKQDDGAGEHD